MSALSPASSGGFVGLIGGTGEVFASSGAIPDHIKKIASSCARDTMLTWEDGYFVTQREPGTGIVIAVGIPAAAVNGPLGVLAKRTAAITLLLMAAGAALSAYYARSIIRPLSLLVGGMKKVGEGVYSQRIDPSRSGSEVGQAVEAFNSMCDKLEKVKLIESVWTERWHV